MMFKANGRSGQMEFDGRNVTIKHEGFVAKSLHGFGSGDKVIPLASITAVQFKPATSLTNGFIQLSIGGETARGYRGGSISGVNRNVDIAKDENAIMFVKKSTPEFQEMADAIRGAINARHEASVAPQPVAADDPMEQITKLGSLRDAGLITTEEFEAKKAVILSRI